MLAVATLLIGLQAKSGADEIYHRVIAKALDRAQAGLKGKVNFAIDHSRWTDPWVVTSAHYEVRSTHSYGQAADLAKNLDFFRSEFVKLLGEGGGRAGLEKVWVFPRMGDYNTFGNEHGADEHSSMLGSYFAGDQPDRPVVAYENGNWTQLWVTHSALHQFLSQEFGRQPETWIDEGLASYFALFWDWNYGADQLAMLQKEHRYVALARIVSEPLQAYAGHSHERFIELGMFFRYLLEDCEATKTDANTQPPSGPFLEYLRAAVRGQPHGDGEMAKILDSDLDLIEQDFRAFAFPKR
jgi:hypothetical protein